MDENTVVNPLTTASTSATASASATAITFIENGINNGIKEGLDEGIDEGRKDLNEYIAKNRGALGDSIATKLTEGINSASDYLTSSIANKDIVKEAESLCIPKGCALSNGCSLTKCCALTKDRSTFQNILENLDLALVQKQIIQSRYIDILENFKHRVKRYSFIFHLGHMIITVGSLFVPALLSIQNSNATTALSGNTFGVYWATFIVSLLVTTFNGVLTLFKIDKKYYFLNTTLERLRTEGWQYFGLTGRYGGNLIGDKTPTHANQFIFFTHQIEKIKMKQVEEEYYKSDEKIHNGPSGQNGAAQKAASELYPPSLNQPLATLDIPDPVKEAVNTLIRSQKILEATKAPNVPPNTARIPLSPLAMPSSVPSTPVIPTTDSIKIDMPA